MRKLVVFLFFVLCGYLPARLHAQSFKNIYSIDTTTLTSVGNLSVRGIAAFGQGDIAIAGAIAGPDTSNWYHQSAYILQTTGQGGLIRFDEYEDNSAFVWQGPIVFGLCADGQGSFYIAAGSNQRQVIIKGTQTGSLEWAKAQHHHEFYDIVCGDTGVTFLGQDESIQGLHDFSISQLNANGEGGFGYMYGTVDFEIPERLIALPDGGFLMVGSTSGNGNIRPMLLRVDAGLELVWGKIFADTLLNRRVFAKDVVQVADGYLVAGHTNGGSPGALDSLMMLKVDTAGNLLWTKTYGNPDWTTVSVVDMELSPAGEVYLAANARDTGYYFPVVLRLDSGGQLLEARSFDDGNPSTEETAGATVWSQNSLYAAGEHLTVLPNFSVVREIFLMRLHDTLSAGCDGELIVGNGSFAMVELGGISAQPFQVVDTFPVRHHDGVVLQEQACYIPVGIEERSPAVAALTFSNPSSGLLRLRFDLPVGGGEVQVLDLNGRLLLQQDTRDSKGEMTLDLGQLADGMYLIRAQGPTWATQAGRLLIFR